MAENISSMAELQTLINQRKGHRGYVTKIIKIIEEIVSIEPNTSEYSLMKTQLVSYTPTLNEKRDILDNLHEKIVSTLNDSAEIENEIMEDSERKTLFHLSKFTIESWTSEHHTKLSGGEVNMSAYMQNTIKLPTLQICQFDGGTLNFHSFWDSLDSSINKNNSLDDITKFNYLISLLSGKAHTNRR